MISDQVRLEHKFLSELAATRSLAKQHLLLQNATDSQLLALVEIAMNLLRGRLLLKSAQRQRLQKHATFARRLARVRSHQTARRICIQEGGGVGAIASLLAPVLIRLALEALQ